MDNNNINFEKVLEIFSPANEGCQCKDPSCAKCLGLNCYDVECEVHTRQAKLKYKVRLLTNLKDKITRLQSEVQNVQSSHPLVRQVAQLDVSIRELESIESGLHIHYKYGYGPNGSVLKRIWGKLSILLFVALIVAIPILSIFGIYHIFTIFF